MLSIIFAVIILAAGNPILMSSVRYVFIAVSFILAVLLFTLGFLTSSESEANGTPFPGLFMALVISFTVGFVVGNMAFPITRVPLGTFADNRTFYGVYPGQYVFMFASMLTIAFVGAIRTNRERGGQKQWGGNSRMKKKVRDSIKNLGTFLDDLGKRLDGVAKEVENNKKLLGTTKKKVSELEAKIKKIEEK